MNYVFNYSVTNARTAQPINRKAESLGSTIYITKDGRTANIRSLLGLLSLAIQAGDAVEIDAVNRDDANTEDDLNNFVKFLERL